MITQPLQQQSVAGMKDPKDAGVFKNACVPLLVHRHPPPAPYLNQLFQNQSLTRAYFYTKSPLKIARASITSQRGCVNLNLQKTLFPKTMKTSLTRLLSIILKPPWPLCGVFWPWLLHLMGTRVLILIVMAGMWFLLVFRVRGRSQTMSTSFWLFLTTYPLSLTVFTL